MRYRLARILILCLASFVLCPSPIWAAAAPTRTDEKGGSFITLFSQDNLIGHWNTFRIIQTGARTTVYLNGKLVVDYAILENYWDRANPIWARGPIQLQTHGSEIRWWNIKVREVPAEEANAILAKHDSEGFSTIFSGQDLTGWAGPIDQYQVKDGVLMCKPEEGGTISATRK